MNARERHLETLLFGTPDKVPLTPGEARESTLAAWHKQGFPEGIAYGDALFAALGIEVEQKGPPVTLNEGARMLALDVSFEMIPTFEERVLGHRDGHYTVQDWMGAIVEISDRYDPSYIREPKDFVTRKWIKFPVENRKDWEEKIKWRYDAETPGRYPPDFEEHCKALENRDSTVGFLLAGPFWQLREWCGFENMCVLMIDRPDFVQDMIDFHADFVSDAMRPILQRLEVDHVTISEDMAYKGHSMISPRMVRRFLLPVYERWISEIKASSRRVVIEMDSDGYVGELLPIWIEAGFNCCAPMEVAAGNDLVEYRRTYGQKMAYRGGIDKRALAEGGKAIEREVMRIVPPLLEGGGFIPSCDHHGVPGNVSWPNFIEYSRLLARLCGWLS